ncbi:MAG: hypothetical protein P8048_07930 [Calditrichia bacterium]
MIKLALNFFLTLILGNFLSLNAIPVDITLNPDNSMNIMILWENPDSAIFFDELRTILTEAISQQEGHLQILKDMDPKIPALHFKISNLQLIQKTVNFIDYHRTKSFFKEKYYFKMLLNTRMFDSELFSSLKSNQTFIDNFNRLFGPHPVFEFRIKFPGRCISTNMLQENNHFFFKTDYQTITTHGTLLTFESSRFIPSVSITMITVLFLLIFILGRYIFSMKIFRSG